MPTWFLASIIAGLKLPTQGPLPPICYAIVRQEPVIFLPEISSWLRLRHHELDNITPTYQNSEYLRLAIGQLSAKRVGTVAVSSLRHIVSI
jgi:hypothetical protein